jgi:hypothetical protein
VSLKSNLKLKISILILFIMFEIREKKSFDKFLMCIYLEVSQKEKNKKYIYSFILDSQIFRLNKH